MRYLLIIAVAALVLLCGGCKLKKGDIQTALNIITPLVIGEVQNLVLDPDFRTQAGTEGSALADFAVAWLLPRLQNDIDKLASSADPAQQKSYRIVKKANPDLSAMLYRIDANGNAVGIWVQVEALLRDWGYIGQPSTKRRLAPVDYRFTTDQFNSLQDVLHGAIPSNYSAVVTTDKAHLKYQEAMGDGS